MIHKSNKMKYKIYKLIDNTNGNIYIGITKQKLYQRFSGHKSDPSCVSRKIIANGDYKIELIEETDDKTRERYWIENTECINITIPGRSWKEYQETKEYKTMKKNYDTIRYNWYSSMGGSPWSNKNSLLKIDISLFE